MFDQTNWEGIKHKQILFVGVLIPRHLLTTEEAEILKNVVLHSVATAFASMV